MEFQFLWRMHSLKKQATHYASLLEALSLLLYVRLHGTRFQNDFQGTIVPGSRKQHQLWIDDESYSGACVAAWSKQEVLDGLPVDHENQRQQHLMYLWSLGIMCQIYVICHPAGNLVPTLFAGFVGWSPCTLNWDIIYRPCVHFFAFRHQLL